MDLRCNMRSINRRLKIISIIENYSLVNAYRFIGIQFNNIFNRQKEIKDDGKIILETDNYINNFNNRRRSRMNDLKSHRE